MSKRAILSSLIVIVSTLLFACSGEKLELQVKVRMDGQPTSQARIVVDGNEIGLTDTNGVFSKIIRKKPGAEVEVVISKDMPGYHITPWKNTFVMRLPKDGSVEKYAVDANLVATRYITIVVTEKGMPVKDASIAASGKEMGKTDSKGEFIYEYKEIPKSGLVVTIAKPGYATWHSTNKIETGQRLDVVLSKRAVVTISAITEEYGQSSGISGITVSINNKSIGKTDAKGVFVYSYNGEPGKKMQISLSAPGYIPDSWKSVITLDGEVWLQRYFYPTKPKPIRAGIYRFIGNTPGTDLKDILAQTEQSVANQIFKNSCFHEVPTKTLQAEIKQAKLSIEKITVKGWRDTPLRRTIDMIILGSVAKDDKGFLIETKFYTSGGKLILSQLNRASSASDINSVTKELAANIMERFPFEGTVVSKEEERYRLNLGKPGYKISRGMEFDLMAARLDESGKVSSYRDIGRVIVKKADDTGSLAEVEDLKKGEKINIGDRVIRRIYREDQEQANNYFVLMARGGVPPDVSPLGGVNVYLNEEWVGSTGVDGKAEVPIRVGKKYNIVLYHHGYQQVKGEIRIEKNKDLKEFVLQANNALFKVESQPSSADVYVDGDKIGTTPISGGKLVGLGFHTVKISVGGDFRDWEDVVEFAQKVEDRTGDRKIILQKDYLKIGERAEQKDDVDGAILAYRSTEKGHPDYSLAHNRLAQIYLDKKNDYDAAIREFENVLSLPENRDLLYKQYAVTYTNLGHAYYEKGSSLVQKDKDGAAQAFGKAIQNLQIAKQNTRFFPNVQYDEAVHDTYYYQALSYHKLYLITRKPALLNSANLAWREYFDFFPKKLEGNSIFEQSRETAQKYWDQIRNL